MERKERRHRTREFKLEAVRLVHLPAGTTHSFRFGKGGGEMVSMTSRLGASQCLPTSLGKYRPINRIWRNSLASERATV
jgi:hypothetical protein